MRRIVSFVLAVLIMLSVVPVSASAATGSASNVALGKRVITSRTNTGVTSVYQPITCNAKLNDGIASTAVDAASINDNTWFAFQTYANTVVTGGDFGTVGTATVDLQRNYDLKQVKVHLANLNLKLSNGAAFNPKATKIEVLVSDSLNGTYTSVGTYSCASKSGAFWATVDLSDVQARFVRVAVTVYAPDSSAYYALLNEIEVYGNPVEPVGAKTLRVGSFNIAHVGQYTFTDTVLDSLANDILSQNLDVVGIQEAVCGVFAAGTDNERSIDSLAELKARTGYPYAYYFNWDDAANTAWGLLSRYPVVNLGTGTLVHTPIYSINQKDGLCNTIPHYAISEAAGGTTIQIDADGTIVNFWNTHCRPSNYAERFALLTGKEENFIMVGDFNNPTYEALTAFTLDNGVKLGSFLTLTNNAANKIITYAKAEKFMDNIMFSTGDFLVLDSGSVKNYSGASDHFLLWAELQILNEEAVASNVAKGKAVTTSRTGAGVTSVYNPIKCNAALTDGAASGTVTGTAINNNTWFAFQTYANTEITGGGFGTVGTAVIDLQKAYDLESVRVHLANISTTLTNGSSFSAKALKIDVLVSGSLNGTYTNVGSYDCADQTGVFWANIDLSDVQARYVKVAVTVDAPDASAYYALMNEIEVYGLAA